MNDVPGPFGSPAGPLSAAARRQRISALIELEGFVRVSDLASLLGVSTVTVRGDLHALEMDGLVRRIRGGAMAPGAKRPEQPFEVVERDLAFEKEALGRSAAALVADGDTILLDVGTTTTAIARALVARGDLHEVTVVTNGLTVALVLEGAWPRISVIVTGGTLRRLQHSLVNPLGTVLLDGLNATIAFVGCNGIDVRGGVTNVNAPEAEIKRAMLLAARRPIVVADASKLGEIDVVKICDLSEVSQLITNASADVSVVGELEAAGCDVRIATDEPRTA